MNFLRRLFGITSPPPTESGSAPLETEAVAFPDESLADSAVIEEEVKAEAEATSPPTAYPGTRQLPPLESALSRPNQHIAVGHSSDVGMVRSNNQDTILTFFASQGGGRNMPDFGLFIVADGMGGHHDGEKASSMATSVLAEQIAKNIYLPTLSRNEQETDANQPTITEILTEAMQKANEAVVEVIPEGGTTVTAAAVLGDLAYIVHVGDSRAYLITQDSGMEQITRDHSLVQRLIELDQLTPEEAAQHPQKNVLYRAIGQSDTLEVDTVTRRLPANSHFLICSDGLWNMVPEDDILQVILNSDNPQETCDHLVFLANDRGGADNISAILLHIPGNES